MKIPFTSPLAADALAGKLSGTTNVVPLLLQHPPRQQIATPSAIVYCEANFGHIDGKTANGLVRFPRDTESSQSSIALQPVSMPAPFSMVRPMAFQFIEISAMRWTTCKPSPTPSSMA